MPENRTLYFIDKDGEIHVPARMMTFLKERTKTFVVVKKGKSLLCALDGNVYTFPKLDEFENLRAQPCLNFSVVCPVYEKKRYYKEKQNFRVYDIETAKIEGKVLNWCLTEDILLGHIPFDATLRKGFNNLYVRVDC